MGKSSMSQSLNNPTSPTPLVPHPGPEIINQHLHLMHGNQAGPLHHNLPLSGH
jgi:hypothetical protein